MAAAGQAPLVNLLDTQDLKNLAFAARDLVGLNNLPSFGPFRDAIGDVKYKVALLFCYGEAPYMHPDLSLVEAATIRACVNLLMPRRDEAVMPSNDKIALVLNTIWTNINNIPEIRFRTEDLNKLTTAVAGNVQPAWSGMAVQLRQDLPAEMTADAFFKGLIPHLKDTWKGFYTQMYCNAYLAMAKMGTASETKIEKVVGELKENTGYDIAITREALRTTYSIMKSKIDAGKIGDIFAAWAGGMANVSLRMQLTLQQAACAGLTQVYTIRRAVETFPNFPWDKVGGVLPEEMDKAIRAWDLVRDDVYYGFKADLGDAKATLYPNLAWVCKELLIRKVGAQAASLRQYKGWAKKPKNQEFFETLIDEYQEDRQAPDAVTGSRFVDAFRPVA